MKTPEIVVRAHSNGEGMVIRYETTKGTTIFGLGLPNIYSGTDWDLGPTWCYLIMGRKITLVDTGRFGNYEFFKGLLKRTGMELSDIDRIIISHSHEDHDGNLAPIAFSSKADLWAHRIYRNMISYHPNITEGARHPELPGSCRLCFMPEGFYKQCLSYHEERSRLKIDHEIDDEFRLDEDGLHIIHTPGHTPDSVSIVLEENVLFPGDTLLPGITPWPSLMSSFEANREILGHEYRQQNRLYGLMSYINSLSRMSVFAQSLGATLPAHRLYYKDGFNLIHSPSDRAKEIIRFHIDRCRSILELIGQKPYPLEEIVLRHFDPSLLDNMGIFMARNEIRAHLEILAELGDVLWTGEDSAPVQPTGSSNFMGRLESYLN